MTHFEMSNILLGKSTYIKKQYIYIYIYIPNISAGPELDTMSIFKQRFTDFNPEFFFLTSHTKVKEPSLLNYLPKSEGRIVGFIPFSWVWAPCEIQTTSSTISKKGWYAIKQRNQTIVQDLKSDHQVHSPWQ